MKLNTAKILKILDEKQWSRYRLAKEMKMATQTVYTILGNQNGENFTFKTIERFAKALDMDPKDLIE